MRSINRIIKITFLINFDWMTSLSECLVTSAAILTTFLSVLGSNNWSLSSSVLVCYPRSLWSRIYLQRKVPAMAHWPEWPVRVPLQYHWGGKIATGENNYQNYRFISFTQRNSDDNFLENFMKFHVLILFSLQSFYIALQWKKNSTLHLHYKSLIGDQSPVDDKLVNSIHYQLKTFPMAKSVW